MSPLDEDVPHLLPLAGRGCPPLGKKKEHLLWPRRALVLNGNRAHSFVSELLDSFSFVSFGGEDVAFGVCSYAVYRKKLTGLSPAVTEAGQDLEVFPVHDVDFHVFAVGEVHVALFWIFRKSDIPG